MINATIHIHSIQADYPEGESGFLTMKHTITDKSLIRLSTGRLREGALLSGVQANGFGLGRPPFAFECEGPIPSEVNLLFGFGTKEGRVIFAGACVLDEEGAVVSFKKRQGHLSIKGNLVECKEGFFDMTDNVTPSFLLSDIVDTLGAVEA